MNLLLDTHVLLWAAGQPQRLSAPARQLLGNPDNALWFSAASLWEITIKNGLGRRGFRADPAQLRTGLLENGYAELPITSAHAVAVGNLPALHKDPFDRILIVQAQVEHLLLLTHDDWITQYPGPIHRV